MTGNDDLIQAFTEIFPSFVRARLAERELDAVGLDEARLDTAITDGRGWLEQNLTHLLAQPFVEQRRGPLEVFQEAMRFPTEALLEAGAEPAARDEAASRALPGDVFGLAPASSQELGEAAWRAHMAWGMRKAQVMTAPPTPRLAYVGTNLMDRSKIEAAATSRGFELVAYRSVEELTDPPGTVIIDLEFRHSDDAIRAAVNQGSTVVAYGPHVDDVAMVRARSLGATTVLPRSRFFHDIAQYFPTIA